VFETLDVGALNSRFVMKFLREENIAVVGQDLLGESPRKLHFFPETGKVQVRRLPVMAIDAADQERAYAARLAREQARVGDVELFEARP